MLDDGSDTRAPIAGVVAALRAASHDPDRDPPGRYAARRRRRPSSGSPTPAATSPSRRPARSPGAYRRTSLAVLERNLAAGELSLRAALDELDTRIVRIDPNLLANVNTPDDLARL